MSNLTTNYDLYLPLVNNATDQDLWGGYLNDNFTSLDSLVFTATNWVSSAVAINTTVTDADRNKVFLVDSTSGNITLTLPAAATVGSGFTIAVKKVVSANSVIIDGNASETIDGAVTKTLSTQYDAVVIACDGSNWSIIASNLIQVIPNASTTERGIIEIATDAEVQTGTDTDRAVVPSSMKAAIGFSKYYESSQQTITDNTAVSVAHSLGAAPKLFIAEMVNVITQFGYAVGDVVPFGSDTVGSNVGVTAFYNATVVGFVPGSSIFVIRKDTGVQGQITNANWRVVLRAWA